MKKRETKETKKKASISQEAEFSRGLSSKIAEQRLKVHGYNELSEKEESNIIRLLNLFWGPIPWMIEIALILSAIVQKWEEFIIIGILLLINVLVGYFQESKALDAIKILKEKLVSNVIVLRDGEWLSMDARFLVPGDIIKLKIGDIVPADVRLVQGAFVLLDQSALTGESLPVTKKKGDAVYSNSVVKQGEMKAIVTLTGEKTFFGKTVRLVAKADKNSKSHFEKVVIRVGNYLILLSLIVIFFIILFGIQRHESYIEVFKFALVLAISAIPVALPAVLTVTMSIGAVNLARKHVVVTRLATIEELARMDILCTDKTGTLTKNKMIIKDVFSFGKYSEEDVVLYSALASKKENKDPIEMPIFNLLEQKGRAKDIKMYKEIKFSPFDPISKRTESTVLFKRNKLVLTKGAPQVILSLCKKDAKYSMKFKKVVDDFASKGFRALAVAQRKINEKEFHMVGLIALFDPPRDDSNEAISGLNDLGVDVKMITGDHIAVAKYIANILNIGSKTVDRWELNNESSREYVILSKVISRALYKKIKKKVSSSQVDNFADSVVKEVEKTLSDTLLKGSVRKHESEIIKMIENTNIFAEVYPEDKYFIVDTLQKGDHAVGMTGDGVNDSPALRKADVGIAVSGSTDAAKAAASMVLIEPGLDVILHAIKVARQTFERMNSYTIFRIAETLRIVFFMGLSILIYNIYPLTTIMIIILALLNDIPILTIAYDNTNISDKPINWDLKSSFLIATFLGVFGVVSSFLLLFVLLGLKMPLPLIQSLFFAKLIIAGHGTIYNTRIKDWFWKKPYPSLALFGATFSTRIIGTIIAVYGFGLMMPIGWIYAGYMWLYALAWFVINDVVKKLVIKFYYINKNPSVIKQGPSLLKSPA